MEEELLFGKYRVLRLLANGSGGEVFLAEHSILGEQRIIKRLLKNRPFYEERKKEAHTLKMLHHDAIPRIYDIDEDETACYIIEEDMGGETLRDFLFRQKCLPTSFISHYSIQLCEIIEYLHQNGILYLDVKPENIIICGDRLALIDFGGAIQKAKYSGVVFGTQGYAAPEQYNGIAEEGSDIYGIGCVLGVMLGERSKERKELFRIYEKCVQENPAKRYTSVFALKEELRKACYGNHKREYRKTSGSFGCIGVTGVHEGAESGAFCALLAAYINDREKGRIACIDMSGRRMFGQLYESVFGEQKTIPESFLLQGICFVPEGSKDCIGSYKAKGYTTLILCFGEQKGHLCGEFLCCDRRFVVGASFPWRMQAWNTVSEYLESAGMKQNVTAVLTGGERELLPIRFGKVIELPYIKDVLLPDKRTEKIISSVI